MGNNEFESKDYDQALAVADAMKNQAEAIMGIFNDIDNKMNTLYQDAWLSMGADSANERYIQLKSNYIKIYDAIINMEKHVRNTIARYKSTDTDVSSNVANV